VLRREANPYVVVFALWLLVFAASSQIMIISPILPQIGEELGITDSLLGTLVSAYSLMVGIFAVISGPISDRIGRRRILLMGSGIMTGALALHFFVVDYFSFLAVRVVAGVAGGVLSGAAVSYVGDFFPYNKRGWATGWIMSGSAFGQIFGIPMGVLLAGRFGFRAPFYFFGVFMALTFYLVFAQVPQPDVKRRSDKLTVSGALRDYWLMFRRPAIASASFAYFLMFLGVSVYVVYLPTWLTQEHGFGPGQIAWLFAAGGVANVLTGPQAGKLSDLVGRKGIILFSCVGLSLLMAITTWVMVGAWAAYVLFFFTMVLVAMRISPFSAMLTALVSGHRRGSLMSMAVALGQVGFAVGGAVAGPLYSDWGYRSNTILGAVSVLLMGILVWIMVPEPEGDPEARAMAAEAEPAL
jgi:predicted MFS family arabinose efflux permease